MSIRTGSLTRELLAEDPELVALLLEDYADGGHRRDHCSRADYAAGWLALARRLKLSEQLRGRRRAQLEGRLGEPIAAAVKVA